MTNARILSSSSLVGDTVKNAQGEDLGEVKDIMICTKTNEVQYYVLSFGGILGLGDKLFAIPPEAMSVNSKDDCLTLNISKDLLKDAEGFDKDNWPDFADPAFRTSVYSAYGYNDSRMAA